MASEVATSSRLSPVEQEIARLMVDGLDRDETIFGEHVPAGWPLTLVQAARATGYRVKRARNHLGDLGPFNELRGKLLKARRESEAARNLATAVAIRDNEGEGSAADRTLRLKAIGVIEGSEGKGGVVVNVQQTSNNLVAGYVIRLPASRAEGAPMIEGNVSP
jgi:hypothetical protein